MKKILALMILAGGLAACNENGSSGSQKTDSLKREMDTLGAKIGDKAGEAWDSTKSKAKDLKEEVEARFDSLKKDTQQ